MEDKELIARVLVENLWEFHSRILQADNPLNKMGDIHRKLCRLMDETKAGSKKLILLPRGHLKSSTVTVGWSIQQICKNPNVRILIGSETNANAKAFLKQIRDTFEKNERLRYLYGDHVRKTSRWTDDEITSNLRTSSSIKEPTVFTTGTDQSRTGSHADIVILDDPVSKENINSKEAREKTLLWFREIANNILDPGGLLVVIGTRWHFDDIYQYIIDELKEVFEVFLYQALTDEGYDILRRGIHIEEKEKLITKDMMLFPEKFDVKTLYNLYSGNQNEFFNNQYMNRIVDTESSDFKMTDIQYYDPRIKIPYLNKYMAIDPAISEEKSADYTAITCVGIDEKANWYVLDYDNFRGKPNEVIDRAFRMYERHPEVRKIGIESVQFQKALIYGFRDEERKRGIKLPLHEVKHGPDRTKEQRILSLQPIVSQKRLYLQAGMNELIEQFRTFPKSRYDDLCLVGETLVLTKRGQIPIKKVKVGDLVMTRNGYKKVLVSKQTGVKDVITRFGITATPDHPIITVDGVKKIDMCIQSDTLYIWNEKLLCIEERNFTDTQNQNVDNTGYITGNTIHMAHQKLFIGRFGLIILEKYLKGILFTIKMVTRLIMNYPTWKFYPVANTQDDIWLTMREEESLVNLHIKESMYFKNNQELGGKLQKESHGTKNTGRYFGKVKRSIKLYVNIVMENIVRIFLNARYFAEVIAPKSTITGKRKVYNLMVEDSHEFFANNVLVHNCDSVAMINDIAVGFRRSKEYNLKHESREERDDRIGDVKSKGGRTRYVRY